MLVGVSRKSMIWKTLRITADEALNGTTVLNAIALLNGADILRVHDVKEAVQTVRLIEKLKFRHQIINRNESYESHFIGLDWLDMYRLCYILTIIIFNNMPFHITHT